MSDINIDLYRKKNQSPIEDLKKARKLLVLPSEVLTKLEFLLQLRRDNPEKFVESEEDLAKISEYAADMLLSIDYAKHERTEIEKPVAKTKSDAAKKAHKTKGHKVEDDSFTGSTVEPVKPRTQEDKKRSYRYRGIESDLDFIKKKEEIKQKKIDLGQEPVVFKSDFRDFRKITSKSKTDGNWEWYTPLNILNKVRAVIGDIDIDPSSSETAQENVRAKTYYTIENNGLAKDWKGESLYMNPPYSSPLLRQFAEKFLKHFKNGDVKKGIILTHNSTDTKWAQDLLSESNVVYFPKGRLNFLNSVNEEKKGTTILGQMIIGFNVEKEKFKKEFDEGKCFIPF